MIYSVAAYPHKISTVDLFFVLTGKKWLQENFEIIYGFDHRYLIRPLQLQNIIMSMAYLACVMNDLNVEWSVINRLMNSNCYGLKSSKKTLVFHAPELLSNSEVPKRWKNNYVQTCIWNLACFLFFLFFFSYWLFVGNRD